VPNFNVPQQMHLLSSFLLGASHPEQFHLSDLRVSLKLGLSLTIVSGKTFTAALHGILNDDWCGSELGIRPPVNADLASVDASVFSKRKLDGNDDFWNKKDGLGACC